MQQLKCKMYKPNVSVKVTTHSISSFLYAQQYTSTAILEFDCSDVFEKEIGTFKINDTVNLS